MNSIFRKSMELNEKIELFLDTISKSTLLFDQIIENYLKGNAKDLKNKINQVIQLETEADGLEKEIKVMLYRYTLVPDLRSDILSLVKSLDDIPDLLERNSKDLIIQKPKFPKELHDRILSMSQESVKCTNELIYAVRAFFNQVYLVNDHVNKTQFYEHAIDEIQDDIDDIIFNGDITQELALKQQLSKFIEKIASISDTAEYISDKLTIFSIKREI